MIRMGHATTEMGHPNTDDSSWLEDPMNFPHHAKDIVQVLKHMSGLNQGKGVRRERVGNLVQIHYPIWAGSLVMIHVKETRKGKPAAAKIQLVRPRA